MNTTKKAYKELNRSIRVRNKYFNRYAISGKKPDFEQWQFYVKKCRGVASLLPEKVVFHCEQINLGVV